MKTDKDKTEVQSEEELNLLFNDWTEWLDGLWKRLDEANKRDKKRLKIKLLIVGSIVILLWGYILWAGGLFLLAAVGLLIYLVLLLIEYFLWN